MGCVLQQDAFLDLQFSYFRPDPQADPLYLGLAKLLVVISLGIYAGANLSMTMVSFLEEYEIFVPADLVNYIMPKDLFR